MHILLNCPQILISGRQEQIRQRSNFFPGYSLCNRTNSMLCLPLNSGSFEQENMRHGRLRALGFSCLLTAALLNKYCPVCGEKIKFQLPLNNGSFEQKGAPQYRSLNLGFSCLLTAALLNPYCREFWRWGLWFQLPLNSGSFEPQGRIWAFRKGESFSCLLTAALLNPSSLRGFRKE